MGVSTLCHSQNYFKKYIDSEINCDEFNTQVFANDDSVYLINFIACDSAPYYTNILKYDSKGKFFGNRTLSNIIPNVYSAHLLGKDLFLAGVNNDSISDSKFRFWNGTLDLSLGSESEMNLLESPKDITLNPMGSVGNDFNKVIYGQYKIENNSKVFSFLLWLKTDLSRDSLIVFDSTYDWSIISDGRVDSSNNITIVADGAKIVDHIPIFYRTIRKYNSKKEVVFEWISQPFIEEGIPSLALLDSSTFVIEFVAEENSHNHSLIAINQEGERVWEHIFHIDDPKSLYRINDITKSKDGGLLCCGTYRNVSENTDETGYVCKLDSNGNLLWERVFYDQEELQIPNLGYNKIIPFNSIVEKTDNSIVIGGRVIHKAFLADSKSDILLMILDPNGCITEGCSTFNDITRLDDIFGPEKIWTEANYDFSDSWSYRYKFDSIPVPFGDHSYYQLLKAYSEFSEIWENSGIFLREANHQLFQYNNGNENIIYDFNLEIGDTLHLGNQFTVYDLLVEDIDTVSLFNGDLKRRWILQPVNPADPNIDNTITWVEGIGNLAGFLSNYKPWNIDSEESSVLCVYLNNNLVYDNPYIDSCWVMTTSLSETKNNIITIVPNPATNKIRIVGSENGIISARIYDSLGNLVVTSTEDQIPISGISSGYYFIVVELNNNLLKAGSFIKL